MLVEHRTHRRRLLTTPLYESDALDHFVRDPDKFLETYGAKEIKHDTSATVSLTSFDGRRVVVKRYNNRNLVHPVKRALRRSRAEHCIRNAMLLAELNIATPQPIAAVEDRYGPLNRRAWFLSEYIDGVDLLDWVSNKRTALDNDPVAEQILTVFDKFRDNALAHGDMKGTNLMVANRRLYLLDLDSMRQYSSATLHSVQLARDVRRFLKNWRSQPNVEQFFMTQLASLLDAEPKTSQRLRKTKIRSPSSFSNTRAGS